MSAKSRVCFSEQTELCKLLSRPLPYQGSALPADQRPCASCGSRHLVLVRHGETG